MIYVPAEVMPASVYTCKTKTKIEPKLKRKRKCQRKTKTKIILKNLKKHWLFTGQAKRGPQHGDARGVPGRQHCGDSPTDRGRRRPAPSRPRRQDAARLGDAAGRHEAPSADARLRRLGAPECARSTRLDCIDVIGARHRAADWPAHSVRAVLISVAALTFLAELCRVFCLLNESLIN